MSNLEKVLELLIEGREEEARKVFHEALVAKGAEIYRRLMEDDGRLADDVERSVDDADLGDAEEAFEVDDAELDALIGGDDDGDGDEDGGTDVDDSAELVERVQRLQAEIEELAGKVETLWQVEKEEGHPELADEESAEEPASEDEKLEECGCPDGGTVVEEDEHDVEEFEDELLDAEGRPVVSEDEYDEDALDRFADDFDELADRVTEGHERADRMTEDHEEDASTADEVLAALKKVEDELRRLASETTPLEEGTWQMSQVSFAPDPNREIGAGKPVRVGDRSALPQKPVAKRGEMSPALRSAPSDVSGFEWKDTRKASVGREYAGKQNVHRRGTDIYGTAPKKGDPDALLNHPMEGGDPDGPSPLTRRSRKRKR